MLQDGVFLHVLFFAIGAVQAAMSMQILYEEGLFPATLIPGLKKK